MTAFVECRTGAERLTWWQGDREADMNERLEVRQFNCVTVDGNAIVVICERDSIPTPMGGRRGSWRYKTEDGRVVVPGDGFGMYSITDTGEKLTTNDPAEPGAGDCF